MAVSTLVKEGTIEERIEERKLIVHKVAFDLKTAKNVVERDITSFFGKLGFHKLKHEEIECESVQLFYEPFVVAKANYFLDYYKKRTFRVKVGDDVSEVIVFGQTLKPEVVKRRLKGILRRSHKEIVFDSQERVIHKATARVGLSRTGREIDLTELPSGPAESEPEKIIREYGDKARKVMFSSDSIIDIVRKRTVKRPPKIGRIAKEVFEVMEHAVVYTPIYEARCRHLKTGEIKIIPISGVTSKMLSL